MEPLLLNLLLPLGEQGTEITKRIIAFVDNTKAGVLGSLGLVLLLYTVVSLLQKIETAFNFTWRVSRHRSVAKRFSDYLTITLIGPVLLFSALGLTASVTSLSMIQEAMQIEAVSFLVHLLGRLIPYVLVIGVFTFIYILVPNIHVQFRSALIGGVVAGILWETASWAFTAFVVGSAKYTAIYSVFATLIIFFIWLYVNWLILLIGCNITSYHQQPLQRTLKPRLLRLSNRVRESMALIIMTLVARHYHYHQPAWSADTLAKRLNVTYDVCDLLLKRLVASELLLATADSPPAYVPAYDPATIALADIVLAIRRAGENNALTPEALQSEPAIDNVYRKVENAIEDSLREKNLLELALTQGNEND
jgi:membrane protein